MKAAPYDSHVKIYQLDPDEKGVEYDVQMIAEWRDSPYPGDAGKSLVSIYVAVNINGTYGNRIWRSTYLTSKANMPYEEFIDDLDSSVEAYLVEGIEHEIELCINTANLSI